MHELVGLAWRFIRHTCMVNRQGKEVLMSMLVPDPSLIHTTVALQQALHT